MNFINQIKRLQKLNKLIEQERTGTPSELAERLGISRSKLYELINELRSIGKEVEYNRSIKSFCYADHQKLEIQFSLRIIKQADLERVNGGTIFFSSILFSGRNRASFTLL